MSDRTAWRSWRPSDRAVSEVLSYTLIFTLIISSIAVVSVGGLNSLQSVRDAEQMNNAERAFDVLADNLADVHQQGAPSRATEIDVHSARLYTGHNVTINVTAKDDDSADVGVGDDVVVEHEVRPIIYETTDERRLVYTAGAMFRTNRDGGVVLRRPPFLNRSERLRAPVFATRSTAIQSVGGSTMLVRAVEDDSTIEVGDTNADETYDVVYVNVTSPRYDLWADALEDRALECTENDALELVECEAQTSDDDAPERVYVTVHNISLDIEQ